MSKDRDELLDHDYDGIREYDNPLPRWWTWLFYGTIAFALIYAPYHLLGYGPTGAQEYQAELAAAKQAAPTSAPANPPLPGSGASAPAAAPAVAANNPKTLEAGKAIFAANCVPCHGPQGQGVIGPNLTDDYWLHGSTLADVTHTISEGVPDKGMISWKATLNPEKIAQVAAYVKSLRGTNPPNPKAPQGTLVKE